MVALAVVNGDSLSCQPEEVGTGVNIHPWKQIVHTLRTKVTTIHHNVSAKLAETFCTSWRPSGEEPMWLLGRRYEAFAACGDGADQRVQQGEAKLWLDADEQASSCSSCRGREACATPDGEACGACGDGAAVAAVSDVISGGGASSPSRCPRRRLCEDHDVGTAQDFESAWAQITRMTYRKGFAPMYRCVEPTAGSDEQPRYIRLTSDAGWGCMIRVGQMLLATTLKRHYGQGPVQPEGGADANSAALPQDFPVADADACHFLEQQFLDEQHCPFSIFSFIRAADGQEAAAAQHQLVDSPIRGRQVLTQKKPGDWFGPTTISETIAALVARNGELRKQLAVYVESDGVLYEDEVRALAQGDAAVAALEAAMSDAAPGSSPQSPDRPGQTPAKPRHTGVAGAHGNWGGDSDDEFMVVSTASESSGSAWSPLLFAARTEPMQVSEQITLSGAFDGEFEEARSPDADVLQVGSFQELEPAKDKQRWEARLRLPEAAVAADNAAARNRGVPGDCIAKPQLSTPPSASQPGHNGRWQRAVLLLFPLQLGLEKYVSEDRTSAVLRYFELRSSLGAMGGRPRMAHFFVGRQGRGLMYVDPHVVQPAAVTGHTSAEANEGAGPASSSCTASDTFRNAPTVQTLPVEHIDSSISFAFYCRSEADLLELLADLRRIEAEEANAPIRSEPTRPAALRRPQVLAEDIECLEDTEGSDDESGGSDERHAEPATPTASSPVTPGGGGSSAVPGGCNEVAEVASEPSSFNFVGEADVLGPSLGDNRYTEPSISCSSWAGGSWATVQTGNVSKAAVR